MVGFSPEHLSIAVDDTFFQIFFIQRTPRDWVPSVPQVREQGAHSSVCHLKTGFFFPGFGVGGSVTITGGGVASVVVTGVVVGCVVVGCVVVGCVVVGCVVVGCVVVGCVVVGCVVVGNVVVFALIVSGSVVVLCVVVCSLVVSRGCAIVDCVLVVAGAVDLITGGG